MKIFMKKSILDHLIDLKGKVLLERLFVIDDLSHFDFEAFLEDLIEQFRYFMKNRNGCSSGDYEIVFYRGRISEQRVLGSFLGGSFGFQGKPNYILGNIRNACLDLFEEVKDDNMDNHEPVNVSVGIVGHNY